MARTNTLTNNSGATVDVVVLDEETALNGWFEDKFDAERAADAERGTLALFGDVCTVAVRHAGAAWFVVLVHDHEGYTCEGFVAEGEFCHPDARVVTGDTGSLVCSACGQPA